MSRTATVACLTGAGTAPELMAEAVFALDRVARLHNLRLRETHATVQDEDFRWAARVSVGLDALVRDFALDSLAYYHRGESRKSLTGWSTRQHVRSALRFYCKHPSYAVGRRSHRKRGDR